MGTAVCLLSGITSAERLQIEGSTTVGPIADAFAEYFQSVYRDLEVTVKKTGSGDGAAALIDRRCDIAPMSRFMQPDEEFFKAVQKGVIPVAHVVAMDGVCIIVHPSNPVKELSAEQVRDIFMGKTRNWSVLGGPNAPIVAVSRDSSSGTFGTFHARIMKEHEMGSHVEYVGSNPQAHVRVSKTVGAIAYVGIGFLDTKVKALKIDGIMPTRQTISGGVYPVTRPLFFFTDGYPKLGSMTHKFVTFYLSERGQELIEDKGFVPLTDY
jgi:phosphate transport system substrate-binding protein